MPRRYPEFPIAAVAGCIILDDAIALIRRQNPPSAGEWSLPGGVQNVGETQLAALRREISEETGLGITNPRLLKVGDLMTCDDAGRVVYHYVISYFLVEPTADVLRAGDDARQALWVSRTQLSSLTPALSPALQDIIDSAFLKR